MGADTRKISDLAGNLAPASSQENGAFLRDYWKRVFRRAWTDALSASGWRGVNNLIFKGISLIIAYLLVLSVLNDANGSKSLAEKALAAVVAFPAVLIFFFLFYLFLAPIRIDRDLRTELAQFRSKRTRKLSFGPAEILERMTGTMGSVPSLLLRIGVVNVSDSPALHGRGRLLEVEFSFNGDFGPTAYAEASALPWTGRPPGSEVTISLEPKVTDWLEIAELSVGGGFRLRTLTASPQYPHLMLKDVSGKSYTYRFTVGVYADECDQVTERIAVTVEESGLSLDGLTTSLKMYW